MEIDSPFHGYRGDIMQTTNNTILITGGGTGIGFGLAKAFQALGNKIIIASRSRDVLDRVVQENPGFASYAFDIQSTAEITAFSEWIQANHPGLNVLVNNSGIMRSENVLDQISLTDMEETVATNLMGPLRLTASLLPLLLKQPQAAIINVTSGLAFVPMAITPTYCATKAALHSYTRSLRWQLKNTKVQVVELIPPYVATNLMNGANDPHAMPLDNYINEVMEIMATHPEAVEICVERVKPLRFVAESINYDAVFRNLNSAYKTN